jgi:drug/metabolite transporter (DMT)-like permease
MRDNPLVTHLPCAMQTTNLRRGAASMIVAAVLFAGMGAFVKRAAAELPNEMVVFFRSAFGLLALLPWLLRRDAPSLRTQRLGAHVGRSLIGLGSMACFFYAIPRMPLGEAVLLNYSAPLFIPLIAWAWLREPVSARLFAVIGLGFIGIALILKPGLGLFTPAAIIGLISGVLAAIAMTGARELTRTEPSTRIVFYFTLTCTLASSVPLLWAWNTPPAHLWMPLLGAGVCASAAQLFMVRAYALAPASQSGPFMYATIVFAALLGWMVWGEVPDLLSLVGAVVVCAAGVLMIRHRDSQAGVEVIR